MAFLSHHGEYLALASRIEDKNLEVTHEILAGLPAADLPVPADVSASTLRATTV
jgi:hypothetical protein